MPAVTPPPLAGGGAWAVSLVAAISNKDKRATAALGRAKSILIGIFRIEFAWVLVDAMATRGAGQSTGVQSRGTSGSTGAGTLKHDHGAQILSPVILSEAPLVLRRESKDPYKYTK